VTRARVDVVVVSYNSAETLHACLEPLLGRPEIAVTVVDNASTDGSLDAIAGLPVRAIEAGRNGGFAFGCNLGMAAGSAPSVLFLNPDARIEPRDVDRLLAILDAEPDVALVGPRLIDGEGELIPSIRRWQRASSIWAQALFLHRLFPRAGWANEINRLPQAYDHVAYPEWISGACMLGRRPALEAVGGFDESFFLYCEDMDLCARLVAAGRRVRYEPSATVQHIGGHSAPRCGLLAVLADSRIRFARKHSSRRWAALQRAGIAVDAATHSLVGLRRPGYARGHAAALAVAAGPRTVSAASM
jgi:N-acetylglucosaminyl-diphospho-decaprenol L-rhamnosyltransferase